MSDHEKTQPKRPPVPDVPQRVAAAPPPAYPAAPVERPYSATPIESAAATGPGCFFWLVVGVTAVGFSILIVLLAGAAGWTSGQQVADQHATSTQRAFIGEQLVRIPTDIAANNTYNLGVRLDFLATLTPGVALVEPLGQTATALYLTLQPAATATPTLSPTPTLTPTRGPVVAPPIVPTATVTPTISPRDLYDLDAMLEEAQLSIRLSDYQDAYELLDAILRIDPTYQTTLVRSLALDALTREASRLYASTETLAEAIRLTNLAEQYGSVGDLDYERLLASLYLDALRTSGTGNHAAAIRALREITEYQTEYKGVSINRLLFNEYLAYGDAWVLGSQHCEAIPQYEAALRIFADARAQTKLNDAQIACAAASLPTPDPLQAVTPTS